MYWVYVIPVNGGLKVGHSKNPATRLHYIQSFSAQRLTFAVKRRFKSRRSALDLERLVHRIHGDRRIRGEWFEADALIEIAKTIADFDSKRKTA